MFLSTYPKSPSTDFPRSDFLMPSEFLSVNPSTSPTPQPGEIWELTRTIRSPRNPDQSYSLPAQRFLRGEQPDRYVMIIRERSPETNAEDVWPTFTVMVLSPETINLSDIDIVLPASLSGLDHDVLAETWHILPMLGCNLQSRHGDRLPRAIYDCLMTIAVRRNLPRQKSNPSD
jgi:hypothetical protein